MCPSGLLPHAMPSFTVPLRPAPPNPPHRAGGDAHAVHLGVPAAPYSGHDDVGATPGVHAALHQVFAEGAAVHKPQHRPRRGDQQGARSQGARASAVNSRRRSLCPYDCGVDRAGAGGGAPHGGVVCSTDPRPRVSFPGLVPPAVWCCRQKGCRRPPLVATLLGPPRALTGVQGGTQIRA